MCVCGRIWQDNVAGVGNGGAGHTGHTPTLTNLIITKNHNKNSRPLPKIVVDVYRSNELVLAHININSRLTSSGRPVATGTGQASG